jgi:hypothetical protein
MNHAENLRLAPINQRWLKAIKAAEAGDMLPLVETLFDLGLPVTEGARKMLGDFLSRRKLSKKRGGQRIPIYAKSLRAQHVQLVVDAVRGLQAKGHTQTEAIRIVLNSRMPMFDDPARLLTVRPVNESTLRAALKRRRKD